MNENIYVFYIVTFLVCQEYPIIYANERLACLVLACRQNTLRGLLGVLVERYRVRMYRRRNKRHADCCVLERDRFGDGVLSWSG